MVIRMAGPAYSGGKRGPYWTDADDAHRTRYSAMFTVITHRKTNMGIFSVKPRQLPSRIAAGAFILNSGIGKLSADEATAARLHGFATGAYPFLGKIKPKDFARILAVSEVALGSALLIPFVPDVLAGA